MICIRCKTCWNTLVKHVIFVSILVKPPNVRDVTKYIREQTDHDIIGHISVELVFLLNCDEVMNEVKTNQFK